WRPQQLLNHWRCWIQRTARFSKVGMPSLLMATLIQSLLLSHWPSTALDCHVSAKDHHQPKTEEDESAKGDFAGAKTSVWWDIENCEVPKGCDPHGVVQSIRSVLLKRNYCGPLTIYAYGDTTLSSTGVSLNHRFNLYCVVSNGSFSMFLINDDGENLTGVKDGSDKKLLVDIVLALLMGIVLIDSGSEVLRHLGPKQAQGTKRCRSFCELCNVFCSNHDLTAHLSGKRHRTNPVDALLSVIQSNKSLHGAEIAVSVSAGMKRTS
ncbi:unnamed protein product, partial [Arabidopsis lyrata]